jgi:hypothetical protein
VFHSATFDYDGLGERFGNRAVGIGEAPYLDPNSKSRSQALAEKEAEGEAEKVSEEPGKESEIPSEKEPQKEKILNEDVVHRVEKSETLTA